MEKFYRFAGVELAVNAPEEWMYGDDRTLAPFRVDAAADPHRFTFSMVHSLTAPSGKMIASMDNFVVYWDDETQARYTGAANGDWRNASLRTGRQGNNYTVELKASVYGNGMSAKTVLNAIEAEHLIVQKGGFVFHSSYIRVGDQAILFTAPSGTGKSTQAELWRSLRGAEVINGDRSAVRCTDEGCFACGIPFAGSSQICINKTMPLRAIVYLEQARETTIRRLRGAEAFRRVWEGISVNVWDQDDLTGAAETLTNVLASVPVFTLSCTPDESAILALEGALAK